VTGKARHDFAVATPWLCAALVLGVEGIHKSPALMIVVAASSLVLLMLTLMGAALWDPMARQLRENQVHPATLSAAVDSPETTLHSCLALRSEGPDVPTGAAAPIFSS